MLSSRGIMLSQGCLDMYMPLRKLLVIPPGWVFHLRPPRSCLLSPAGPSLHHTPFAPSLDPLKTRQPLALCHLLVAMRAGSPSCGPNRIHQVQTAV